MRRTATDFSDHEKALMLDLIIDQVIRGYEKKKPKNFNYHSTAELNGYEILTLLDSNGFITSAGILGK